jgi:hypothetical protein
MRSVGLAGRPQPVDPKAQQTRADDAIQEHSGEIMAMLKKNTT